MYFARAAAVVLILLGLAGLVGFLQWDAPASIYHLGLGLLFTYPAFLRENRESVCGMLRSLGVLVLAVKGATILAALVLGQEIRLGPIEVTSLVIGILSLLAARYSSDDIPTRS